MANKSKYDFSGYATKVGLKCSDGRTILQNAFQHDDGQTVPLVWQHRHDSPDNILGHVLLTNKEDGVWADAFFNSTSKAEDAKIAVRNARRGAIDALKKAQKEGEISEDDRKRKETEVQKLTDSAIADIDAVTAAKEKEILG